MDPLIAASMVFTLILVVLIGGFIVLFPLTRRLGRALEVYLDQKREDAPDAREIERIRAAVGSLQREVRRLSEKQEFVERLLRQREGKELEPGEGDGPEG